METVKQKPQIRQKTEKSGKGKYPSIEAASLAKMESAKEFIVNIDLASFRKNGHVE